MHNTQGCRSLQSYLGVRLAFAKTRSADTRRLRISEMVTVRAKGIDCDGGRTCTGTDVMEACWCQFGSAGCCEVSAALGAAVVLLPGD